MGSEPSSLIWILGVSGLTAITLIAALAALLLIHQRRLAEQARAWGMHLLQAQEAERQRIANDLHDDIVQQIHGAQMLATAAGHDAAAESMMSVAADLRRLAHDLHPPALRLNSLEAALTDLAARHRPGLAIAVSGDAEVRLAPDKALALYRIAQEGLHNIVKHSRASSVEFVLGFSDATATLTISDNGVGFSPRDAAGSFGLRSMRERAAAAGGSLEITSEPGKGTAVKAVVSRT